MNNYEFYRILIDHQELYITLLLASIILHYLIFRKILITLFDPYILPVVFSVFSVTTVIFLYITGNIANYPFTSFVFSQIAFWAGLLSFSPLKRSIKQKLADESSLDPVNENPDKRQNVLVFYISTFILLITQLVIYKMKGIPLFMASRLEMFADSQGSGVLGRIVDVTAVCSLYSFFSIIRFDYLRVSELPKYFFCGLIFVTFILSGSKSSFLILVYTFWTYIIFAILKNDNYKLPLNRLRSHMKSIVIISVVLVVGVIYIQAKNNPNNALFLFALRFVHSADVYWYAYPDSVYKSIPGDHPFEALFGDFLGMLRIARWDTFPEAIGITLKNIHHPSKILEGPNARHNVFGLIYFGLVGGAIFSFFLGWILSLVRNVLPFILKRNIVGGIVFAYLTIKLSSFESDPTLAVMSLDNFFFIFPIIIFLMLLVSTIILRKK
jgi:hypothetical protein